MKPGVVAVTTVAPVLSGSNSRPAGPDVDAVDALALDRALTELERIDPDQAELVERRFFAGLTVEETALVLGVSPTTVKREWTVARGWLHRALK